MRAFHWLVVGVSIAALAGCSRANRPDLTTETVDTRGHAIAFAKSATGTTIGVSDKSDSSQEGSIVTTLANGIPTSVDVAVNGSMEGGTGMPEGDNLKVRSAGSFNFSEGDSFLTRIATGRNYVAARYSTVKDRTDYVSYVVGGNKTGNMPTTGSAEYTGKAAATVFGSVTGQADITGTATLNANFAPGGGTIQGRISKLTGPLQGTDILLNPKGLVGSNFQNGELSLVTAGTTNNNANMTGSDYQGAFFGGGAREAAGTFQFGAVNVRMPGGGTQRVDGIGVFGTRKR